MKKRIIAIIAIVLMSVVPAMSQVFISDDEMNENRNARAVEPGAIVPMQDVELDQFLPLGEGMLLLTGLAGAYLLGKQKKKK